MKKSDIVPKRVSVAGLKARLSEYLRIARAGGEVVVTERGKPIARLAPVGRALAAESRLAGLAESGLVRPARVVLTDAVLESERPRDPAARLLEIVLEERASDR